MNFYLLTRSLFLLFLISTTFAASSQRPQALNSLSKPLSNEQNSKKLNSLSYRSSDEFYHDAWVAILKGHDDINSRAKYFDDFFATWENQSPEMPFLGFFDNNNGTITKLWSKETTYGRWGFSLRLYDGNYIDQKFTDVLIDIHPKDDGSFLQSNGTWQTIENVTLDFQYGENDNIQSNKSVIGQLSIHLINEDTQSPVSGFDQDDTDISSHGIQIIFISSDPTVSFKTTLFSRSNPINFTFDNILVCLFAVVYIFISATSWYSPALGKKVSFGSMKAAYISSSFILCWMLFSNYYSGLIYEILVVPVLFDWVKHFYFLFANLRNWDASITAVLGVVLSACVAVFKFIPSIWINLLPCVVFFGPFLQKIQNKNFGYQNYLTRFEISNWTCICLWMSYAFLYPQNYYYLTPQPVLAYLFFSLLGIQFMVLLILQKTQSHKELKPLLEEETTLELSISDLQQNSSSI